MIARISGKVIKQNQNSLFIDVSGICYEVLVPAAIMRRIDKELNRDIPITLVTYHYHNIEPARSVPILIGFLNEIEKDFFLQFISVSGIGPRAAVKALANPLSEIAMAIDQGDVSFLKSLPGIGQQRAKEIVAKLQGKVGKFGLIQDGVLVSAPVSSSGIEEEALEVLVQLQYKRPEAKEMVRLARERAPGITSAEGLLNEVYKQKVKR
ncbi:MAG: Holliday junction branch migration protein RuvA [Candidatus Omnitrophota bacterium]